MLLTEYETTVVLRPDLTGEAVEAVLDKIREVVRQGGKLIAINHWGKRRLGYDIAKQNRGIYVNIEYLGKNNLVAEVERHMRISDAVLRFLSIKVATEVDAEGRSEKEYVPPHFESEDGLEEVDAGFSLETEASSTDPDMDEDEAFALSETDHLPEVKP